MIIRRVMIAITVVMMIAIMMITTRDDDSDNVDITDSYDNDGIIKLKGILITYNNINGGNS